MPEDAQKANKMAASANPSEFLGALPLNEQKQDAMPALSSQEPMSFMVTSDDTAQKGSDAATGNQNVGQLDLFNELDLLNTNQTTAMPT